MPLMGFSEQKHVPMILNGTKKQTTRKPRKNQITVKDTLYCYFKPRMKKGTCLNCITKDCIYSNANTSLVCEQEGVEYCPHWNNKFGDAKIIGIRQVGSDNTPPFIEWMDDSLNRWAVNDGFENFHEADEWFTRVHGPEWKSQRWDIIYFEGDWLKEGC